MEQLVNVALKVIVVIEGQLVPAVLPEIRDPQDLPDQPVVK